MNLTLLVLQVCLGCHKMDPKIRCQLLQIFEHVGVYDLMDEIFESYPRETLEDVLLGKGFSDIECKRKVK